MDSTPFKPRKKITGISIIIVNYFSEYDINNLYRDIARDFINRRDCEIIIVDNSGSFLTKADQEIIRDKNVRIVTSSSGNEGFGRGINFGFSLSKFNKICVINPDISYSDSVLSILAQRLEESGADVGCVTCVFSDGRGARQVAVYNSHIPNIFCFASKVLLHSLPERARNILWYEYKKKVANELNPLWTGCSGALFLMKSHIFEETGGFDPDFFMYCEDTELFRRRFSGRYKVLYFEDLSIEHVQGTSDIYGLMPYQNQVSYLLYLRKCGLAYLLTWLSLITPKYLTLALIGRLGYGTHKKESSGFFQSWTYLPLIIRKGGDFGGLPRPLKIDEIPD